jgi:hypothetical protein
MSILDFSELNINPNDIKGSIRRKPQCEIPGKCELQIETANHKQGDKGEYYATTFTVTAHENPAAVGKEFFVFLNLSGRGAKQTMQVALATGVLTEQMIQQAIATGQKGIGRPPLENALGKRVYGEIKQGTKKGTSETTFNIWDYFADDDPQAENYPRAGATTPEQTGVPVVPAAQAPATPAVADPDSIPF